MKPIDQQDPFFRWLVGWFPCPSHAFALVWAAIGRKLPRNRKTGPPVADFRLATDLPPRGPGRARVAKGPYQNVLLGECVSKIVRIISVFRDLSIFYGFFLRKKTTHFDLQHPCFQRVIDLGVNIRSNSLICGVKC